jgi:outer membrane protein OmpA-like peptidoglycan-associated protein
MVAHAMRRLIATVLVISTAGCLAPIPVPSYPVFFGEASSQLDDPAKAAIAQAADAAKANPFRTVTVAGYADPAGSQQANTEESRLRTQAVADQLVADGVDATRIRRASHGATDFAATSQESRRVEITLGNP